MNHSGRQVLEANAAEMDEQFDAALKALQELASACNQDSLVAALAMLTIFKPAEDVAEASGEPNGLRLELLAYALKDVSVLADAPHPTPQIVGAALDNMESLLKAYPPGLFEQQPEDPQFRKLHAIVAEAVADYHFVRGDAYPEQSERMIAGLFEPFETWFVANVGIAPRRACSLLWAILRRAEDGMNQLRAEARVDSGVRADAEDASTASASNGGLSASLAGLQYIYDRVAPVMFASWHDVAAYAEGGATPTEWSALLSLIGLTAERQKVIEKPVDVRQFPLLCAQDGRLFPTDVSHCCGQLLEALEQRIEQSEYRDAYVKHRGEYLERATVDALKQVFETDEIFCSVKYPDPDHNYTKETELDCLVHCPPFVVFIECKSNRVRMPTNVDDHNGLKDAVQRIVGEAYDQAYRAWRYLDDKGIATFREKGTARSITLDKSELRRTYFLSVSLRQLANVTSQLSRLDVFGLVKKGRYPVALHLPVLELVVKSAARRATILHYLERRSALHEGGVDFHADELDIFGAYLKTRLQMSRFTGQDRRTPNWILLDGYTQRFDAYVVGERGVTDQVPLPKLELPAGVQRVYEQLQERVTPDGIAIAFALLDMNDSAIGGLERSLNSITRTHVKPGDANSLTTRSGDSVIVTVCGHGTPHQRLHDVTARRLQIEKYRHRTRRAAAFAIDQLADLRLRHALYYEQDWKFDAELESEVASSRAPQSIDMTTGRSPGRNEACPCGSGKKFKKCCMPR